MDLDLLVEKSNFIKRYQDIPQYPAVFRDLAILVNEEVTWSFIEKCIIDTKVDFLKEIKFLDIYRGKQVSAGKKSIAFNLCFRQRPTLKGEEVDNAQQTIINALNRTLGAELRRA